MSFVATWMDLEIIILSQSNKYSRVFTNMCNLKKKGKWTNIKKKETENKLVVTGGEGQISEGN